MEPEETKRLTNQRTQSVKKRSTFMNTPVRH